MKTKIRIIRLSDDSLNDVNGGIRYSAPAKAAQFITPKSSAIGCKYPSYTIRKTFLRGKKTFTKGNLIGFCHDCHVFVYEYNLSLHQDHNIICAGGR